MNQTEQKTGRIMWDTDVNAPGCPGQIVNLDDESQTILVQTDWDYPAVAQLFGWSLRAVQPVVVIGNLCDHGGTDGTIDCPECGLPALDFITAAGEWLDDNDGAEADDGPGYFSE
jgi:hypothetical protein